MVEAGTGSLEPRHAVVPIRSFLRHKTFRMAEVVELNPKQNPPFPFLYLLHITISEKNIVINILKNLIVKTIH